jgi:hypothetical protein
VHAVFRHRRRASLADTRVRARQNRPRNSASADPRHGGWVPGGGRRTGLTGPPQRPEPWLPLRPASNFAGANLTYR